MKVLNIVLLLIIKFNLVAQSLPIKPDHMAIGKYNKYKLNLDSAFLKNDSFEIAIQLANLEANPDSVFLYMKSGILQNNKNCDRIFNFYNIYKENGMMVNIVKLDTLKFEMAFKLCVEELGKNSYFNYLENKEKEYQIKLSKRVRLDTTLFDKKLIKELDKIIEDDQLYRLKMDSRTEEKSETYKLLWAQQHVLDSINLVKVEKIINDHGYLGKEKIGYNHANTISLVLHHQSNYELRMKYLPVLEKAFKDGKISQGWLDTYKWRNENIRLEKNEK
jgi:hypothetical protein